MAMRRKGAGFFQNQGTQQWRPQSGVEIVQGNPLGFDQRVSRQLQKPLIGGTVGADAQQQNVPISWISQTFSALSAETVISAQPNRVILIIQNISSTDAAAVNFDQTASVNGASPNWTSQGILLVPSTELFIDKWCPTGTIHVAGAGAVITVTQAYSAIGNVPFIET